ncbi:YihY/virulence factor BrkB family protein [Devosia salina]|uniref:YihY/virulence factor BrkB family protein n=2 Tax=Devosia salina TaxID=2860336 RepID=A0ABX8WNF3_9HYPH|nr:YihY/virulence factor BrkB family protein [Devosia salina]
MIDERYAAQSRRGRAADAPGQIPQPGWKDIGWRLFQSIGRDRVLFTSAAVSFYILLALVPTLNAFVSIYGLFNDATSVLDHVDLLAGVVPPGALGVVRDQLTRLAEQSRGGLGLSLLFSIGVALWGSSAGVKAMFEAMNIAYHEQENRSFIAFNGLALLFALAGAIAALLVIAVLLVVPSLVAFTPWSEGMGWTARLAAYAAMVLVLWVGVAALYRWGPSREQAKWRWITPGSVFSALLLSGGSVVFSWYVSNFSDDSAAYGSLGAVIGLMIWLWISTTIVILGAELNSEVEHQTARDSTTGPAEPLGERGARMADTVGRVWPPDREAVEIPEPRDRRKVTPLAIGILLPTVLVALLKARGKSETSPPPADPKGFTRS